jgi:hypothetical protein
MNNEKHARSHLINRRRWRGERFWPAARRDAGRIPAVGFNRGTTMQPAKRSTAPGPFPKELSVPSSEHSGSTPLRIFMRWLLTSIPKLPPPQQKTSHGKFWPSRSLYNRDHLCGSHGPRGPSANNNENAKSTPVATKQNNQTSI